MLYNIILKLNCLEILVIENVGVDDFAYIMPIIDKMKFIYNDKEQPVKIELERVGEVVDGEDV